MNLTVEWFDTTAGFTVDGGVDGLSLPARPGLRVIDADVVDLAFEVASGSVSVDGEVLGPVGSVQEGWDRAWRHLELQMAARSVDLVFVHAGAVAIDGRGYVIPGRSGLGKTTLVLDLLRAGATYYSDEYALLDAAGRLHPYARDPHVRTGGGGRGVPTPIGSFTDRVGDGPVPVAGVILTRYEAGASWDPEDRDLRTCVLALLDNAVGARTRTPAVLDAIAAAAGSAWCVEGVRGEVPEAAEWITWQATES